jgi:hypothetical protein
MAAKSVQLADDVTTVLNGTAQSWAGSIVAERLIVPRIEQEKIGTAIKCYVSPTNIAGGELVTRAGKTQDDYTVFVALLKNMTDVETESATMIDHLETMRNWLKQNRSVGGHTIIGEIPTNPLMSEQHAREKSLYLGVLALTIRVIA